MFNILVWHYFTLYKGTTNKWNVGPIQVLNDEGTTNKWNADPIQVPIGPITRAWVKKFKETLNGLIQNIWVEVNSWRRKEDALHIPQGWISIIQTLE